VVDRHQVITRELVDITRYAHLNKITGLKD